MNDAEIDSRYTVGVEMELLDGDRGGNVEPQPVVMHQGDRSDLLGCVWNWTGQPNPQRGVARGDRQAHSSSYDPKRPSIESDWHEATLTSRETDALPTIAACGRGKPRIGVPLYYRSRSRDRQLAKIPPRG
jgi:hypothetical protein